MGKTYLIKEEEGVEKRKILNQSYSYVTIMLCDERGGETNNLPRGNPAYFV